MTTVGLARACTMRLTLTPSRNPLNCLSCHFILQQVSGKLKSSVENRVCDPDTSSGCLKLLWGALPTSSPQLCCLQPSPTVRSPSLTSPLILTYKCSSSPAVQPVQELPTFKLPLHTEILSSLSSLSFWRACVHPLQRYSHVSYLITSQLFLQCHSSMTYLFMCLRQILVLYNLLQIFLPIFKRTVYISLKIFWLQCDN